VIRHPIFVVGMPRSGTTLLSAMLDAHSQIAISPETHFYTHCQPSATDSNGRLAEAWEWLQQQPGVQDLGLSKDELERIWRGVSTAPSAAPPDLLQALLSTYAERTGAEAWGEKTPDHLAHVPEMFEDFPRAVVLAIVRDPRDVCLSLRGLPWNYDSPPESAWKWRRYARRTERYAELFSSQFREVRYEQLLETPERVLRDVLNWIGAPFEEGVLSFHRGENSRAGLTQEPWKRKAARPIDPSNKEKWKGQMSPAERWIIQEITGKYLRKKGYEPAPVALDGTFWRTLIEIGGRSIRKIGSRIARRWRTPSRDAGDHRPTWIRRREAGPDDSSRIH